MKLPDTVLLVTTLASALAGALAAQGPSLATQTSVGVFARTGARAQIDAIAPLTVITGAVRIHATAEAATASLGVGPGATPDSFVLSAGGTAGATTLVRGEAGTTTSSMNTVPTQGPVAFLLSHRGPARRIRVAMGGDSTGGGMASLAVDVGDDGSVEFRQAVDGSPHAFDFVLGGAGATSAKLVVNAHAVLAANSLRAGYQLDALFSSEAPGEQPCQFTAYGQGCDGLGLGGTDRIVGQTHAIELNVRGAFPNGPVVLMFGERPLDVLIPGYRCSLYVNPLVSLPIQADAQGNLDNTFFIGPGLAGLTFIQAAALRVDNRVLLLKTSNGARMDCGR